MVAKPVPPHEDSDNTGPLDARIEARCSAWAKETIQRAAAESGRSVSDFVVAAALDSARELLLDQRVLRLNEHDTRVLLDELNAPPRGIPELRAAVQRHRELFGDEG